MAIAAATNYQSTLSALCGLQGGDLQLRHTEVHALQVATAG